MNSPIWRFALAPGVCGERGWAGVLKPSVDRVGRYFPLTVAVGWRGQVQLLECVTGFDARFSRIEELALSSLHDDFSLDAFAAAMCGLAGRPGDAAVWWTDGAPQVAPCLLVCRGLPSTEAFTALLDGGWQRHGWGGPA